MNRFEAEVRARSMIAFAHIDHAAGASAVGLPLRPTELQYLALQGPSLR
jgi:hypothetical protein